jgi:superfamily II DNA or RNA helicase
LTWADYAFSGTFRRYQSEALVAFEQLRATGVTRAHLALPPGAGKTVLGLEVSRRLGRRTLVLSPNTAVQAQWVAQWSQFHGEGLVVTDKREVADLTVLTYQAMTSWDRADEATEAVQEQRRRAVRGEGDLLSLLHPNARAFIEAAADDGPWTLVLDECHHLLEVWGALAGAVVEAFGDGTWVVGLTATPPVALTGPQRDRLEALFGVCDVVVDLPSVVKEGDLAPYQELILYCSPSAEEDTWIAAERTRFDDLQLSLVEARTGSLPFVEWLRRRLEARTCEDGAPMSWGAFERLEPELARAGLRLVHQGLLALPAGGRMREEHLVPADAQDWAAVLSGYALEQLIPSEDPGDLRLLADIRRVLPGLGWVLTRKGLRVTTSPVDRVCSLSESKASATVQLLAAEQAALGADLRALVLCDYEDKAAQAPSHLGEPPRSGSAVGTLHALSSGVPELRPVMVTGKRVAASRSVAVELAAWVLEQGGPRLDRADLESQAGLVELVSGTSSWGPRDWTPLLTRYLAEGGTRCLVGTRGLLGEGWDCPSVAVVVDLTTASTATAVTQMRGRGLRRDPARPAKVADAWTVVCVADGHPRGDADHLRAARKQEHHLSLSSTGEITSGISHCDPVLTPFTAPVEAVRLEVNARSRAGPGRRAEVRAAWHVGQPYDGVASTTLRVRLHRDLGMAGGLVPVGLLRGAELLGDVAKTPQAVRTSRRIPRPWPVGLGVAALADATAPLLLPLIPGLAIGTAVGAAVAAALGMTRYVQQSRTLSELPEGGALEQIAQAVAEALNAVGDTSATNVTLRPAEDGWLRCELVGVAAVESALFADALDELLAPLAEPRAMLSRLVLPNPTAEADRRRLARARALGRPVDASVAWHAVPSVLSRSGDRVRALVTAWEAHVGPTRTLNALSPEGQAVLELLRGADPYAVTSQLRTVWH